MALSFTRISWLWRGAKEKELVPNNSTINQLNSVPDWGLALRGEPESLKLQSTKRGGDRKVPSSSRKSRRKWKSREHRIGRIDREYDVILVPSDGGCLSGSESDDSEWSIGWLEHHPPDFQSFDEADDDSFAVLVPCYKHGSQEMKENGVEFLGPVKHLQRDCSTGGKDEYMERWLSSLQNL